MNLTVFRIQLSATAMKASDKSLGLAHLVPNIYFNGNAIHIKTSINYKTISKKRLKHL